MDAIAARVRTVIRAELGLDEDALASASALRDLGADSMDLVSLTMALEDEFKIEISDRDAAQLLTVQHVVDYVQAHVVAPASGEKAAR